MLRLVYYYLDMNATAESSTPHKLAPCLSDLSFDIYWCLSCTKNSKNITHYSIS